MVFLNTLTGTPHWDFVSSLAFVLAYSLTSVSLQSVLPRFISFPVIDNQYVQLYEPIDTISRKLQSHGKLENQPHRSERTRSTVGV